MARPRKRWSTPASCLILTVGVTIVVGFAVVVRTAHELSAQVVNPPDRPAVLRSADELKVLRNALSDRGVRTEIERALDLGAWTGLQVRTRTTGKLPVHELALTFDGAVGRQIFVEYRRFSAASPSLPPDTVRVRTQTVPAPASGVPVVLDDTVELEFLVHALERAELELSRPLSDEGVLRGVWVDRAPRPGGDLLMARFDFDPAGTVTSERWVVVATYRAGSGFSGFSVR